MNRTPRILIVTRNLPPLVGGMERLNWHIAKEMSRYADVRVVGPKGSASVAPEGVSVDEMRTNRLGAFLVDASLKSMQIARSWKPDIVFAGSGLTGPIAVTVAKIVGARSVIYAHGLDLTVDHFAYRQIWLPLIRRAKMVVVNSTATRRLAMAAGVDDGRIEVVHPGVELPAIVPESDASQDVAQFRSKHGIGPGKILISVGRLTQRKGVLEFVRDCLPLIVRRHPQCTLAIVGDAPVHALAASVQSMESIEAAARLSGVDSNVRFVGKVSDDELAAIYRCADLHVFPIREIRNDPEGFGMVAIEAAAYGVPTVAYRTGGVPDAVEDGLSGRLIEPGNATAFAHAAMELLDQTLAKDQLKAFAERFSWDRIGGQMATALRLTETQGKS